MKAKNQYLKTLLLTLLTFLLGAQNSNASQTALRFEPLANVIHLSDDAAALTGYSKLGTIEEVYVAENGITKLEDVAIYKNAEGALAWRALAQAEGEWMDDIYNLQKTAVNQNKNIIANASNNAKGAWGEMASDAFLTEKSYQPLHNRKTALTQGWGETGIDGIFKKDGQYYIVEAKYSGTSQLKMTNDGKQMSDTWIQSSNRLDDILGANIAQDLRETGNYRRILAKVQPDGTIIFKELDANANTIGNFTP